MILNDERYEWFTKQIADKAERLADKRDAELHRGNKAASDIAEAERMAIAWAWRTFCHATNEENTDF